MHVFFQLNPTQPSFGNDKCRVNKDRNSNARTQVQWRQIHIHPAAKLKPTFSVVLLVAGLYVIFNTCQEAAATAPAPATAPATTVTGDDGAAAAAVTATERAAAAEAARLAKRVERFGRIAPVTETEAAEKLAKRREKFGLPEPVGVQFAWFVYIRTYSTRSCVRLAGDAACPFLWRPAGCRHGHAPGRGSDSLEPLRRVRLRRVFFFCGGPS